jgi:hypothetical protein
MNISRTCALRQHRRKRRHEWGKKTCYVYGLREAFERLLIAFRHNQKRRTKL